MNRHLPLQQLVLALVVGALLFAQILGLHHHLHPGDAAHAGAHSSELHFGDAGLHAEDQDAADHHPQAQHHSADDVEVPAIDDVLAKTFVNLLPLALFLAATILLLPPLVSQRPQQRGAEPAARRHPFSLHPPANGPPGLSNQSV